MTHLLRDRIVTVHEYFITDYTDWHIVNDSTTVGRKTAGIESNENTIHSHCDNSQCNTTKFPVI